MICQRLFRKYASLRVQLNPEYCLVPFSENPIFAKSRYMTLIDRFYFVLLYEFKMVSVVLGTRITISM